MHRKGWVNMNWKGGSVCPDFALKFKTNKKPLKINDLQGFKVICLGFSYISDNQLIRFTK